MNEKFEIRSVEMVRRIRDEFADVLKGKSPTEIIAFFKKAAAETREEINRRRTVDFQSESCG